MPSTCLLRVGRGGEAADPGEGVEVPQPEVEPKELLPDPAAAKDKLKLLLLSCGNKDGLKVWGTLFSFRYAWTF